MAQRLVWSFFVNRSDLADATVPADLHKQSQNDLMHDAEGEVVADAQGRHLYDAAWGRIRVTVGTVGGGETAKPEVPAEERSITKDAYGQPVKNIALTDSS